MPYPTLEQYQETLQHPGSAFTDPSLKSGRIRASGLGLPVVVSGGFALTYSVELPHSKRYAVRCFHREAPGLEKRYAAISKKIKGLASPYFVDFDFQPQGIKVGGTLFPVVKMAWAEGETLGEFVETNYGDKAKLSALLASLANLSAFLEKAGIAHGDIQEGNLMVADAGRRVQLIDYDGIYVPEIAGLGGSEMGHRDYQHPRRGPKDFNERLDRFSFIALNLALRALCERSGLWRVSQSGAGVILLRANDFKDPAASKILAEIRQISNLARDVQNFIAVCAGELNDVPTLSDFLVGKGIPAVGLKKPSLKEAGAPAGYISQYPVLNACDYAAFARSIGKMVELVGKVVEVSEKKTRHGKPYIFINFSYWNGQCVKLNIWSEALGKGGVRPTGAWVGKWVTIKGLVEPIYRNPNFKYEHIAITVANLSQLVQLTEAEATYRLTARQVTRAISHATRSNRELLSEMGAAGGTKAKASSSRQVLGAAKQGLSTNQQLLNTVRQHPRQAVPSPSGSTRHQPIGRRNTTGGPGQKSHSPSKSKNSNGIPWWVWLIGLLALSTLMG